MGGKKSYGFTIVELLIVMAIIAILASIVFSTFNTIQEQGRNSVAQKELLSSELAILKMSLDVNKLPNGCPIGDLSSLPVAIEAPEAGLVEAPPEGVILNPCVWTAEDIVDWRGPYLGTDEVLDPWNNSYIFEAGYTAYSNCPSQPTAQAAPSVASYGADGQPYTCDDHFRILDNY